MARIAFVSSILNKGRRKKKFDVNFSSDSSSIAHIHAHMRTFTRWSDEENLFDRYIITNNERRDTNCIRIYKKIVVFSNNDAVR